MSEKDIEASRPVDALVMAADVLELGSRRPDLSDAQRSELYFAALSRFRDFPGSETGLAQPWQIFAWIDIVSPREGHLPSQGEILQEEFIRALIGVDPDRLLLGRDPSTTAAPLAALALKRTDLSVVQRHELLMAARGRLARPGYGRKLKATTGAILAWIDVVVPPRTRPTAVDGKRNLGRPKGNPTPSLPETDHREPPEEPPRSHAFRTGKPGPSPMLTREKVERMGQDLASRGLPAGERSIARELGVSRDAVRYALGKDQGRRSRS